VLCSACFVDSCVASCMVEPASLMHALPSVLFSVSVPLALPFMGASVSCHVAKLVGCRGDSFITVPTARLSCFSQLLLCCLTICDTMDLTRVNRRWRRSVPHAGLRVRGLRHRPGLRRAGPKAWRRRCCSSSGTWPLHVHTH
jgi:hypothetical protein